MENLDIKNIAKNAKSAFFNMMNLDDDTKNLALKKIAKNLISKKEEIFEANKKDLIEAQKLLDNKEISLSTYNRLK